MSSSGDGRHDHRALFGSTLPRGLQLPILARRYNERRVVALYVFINSGIAIAVMAGLAMASSQPFVFPSLGPTAFLLFYSPLAPSAAPRSCFYGHLIGVLAAYFSLVLFGLTNVPPDLYHITPTRIAALALALALTLALMTWLDIPHAPAGATTLIVALGLLRTPEQLAILMLAVVVLTAQGFVINRLAGLPYPAWRPLKPESAAPGAPQQPQR
jgi:CBS domain-containing membrane protein